MPRAKGPRLWLKPAERDREAVWIIKDGNHRESTGCGVGDREEADRKLADYIISKYAPERKSSRRPAEIPVADVINIYLTDKAPSHARPKETGMRCKALMDWWGDKTLAEVNGSNCRAYAEKRPPVAARRELEDLRAAINHHRKEGLCSEIVGVALPDKPESRERWLTRSEAARLLWAAWSYREVQKGVPTDRRSRRHVARFILVGLYTGTRAAAICGAAIRPTPKKGYVDLERGVFYRRPHGKKKTKKAQPPARLSNRLLAHLRRWERLDIAKDYVVEWNGKPVERVRKAFQACVGAAELEDVTPHTLRHTAATWLMQAGADPWDASGLLGMSTETLIHVYGHHHPDYQADAAERLSGGLVADRKPVNRREQEASNVTKIADFPRQVG